MKEFINSMFKDEPLWRIRAFVDKMKTFLGECTTNQQELFIREGYFIAQSLYKIKKVESTVITREGRMFKFEIPTQITQDEAMEIQAALCYPSAGYGFYKFESTDNKTTWYCGDSSD